MPDNRGFDGFSNEKSHQNLKVQQAPSLLEKPFVLQCQQVKQIRYKKGPLITQITRIFVPKSSLNL
jgi:hypothetical protein